MGVVVPPTPGKLATTLVPCYGGQLKPITFAAEPNQRPAGHHRTDFRRHSRKNPSCEVPGMRLRFSGWIDGHVEVVWWKTGGLMM